VVDPAGTAHIVFNSAGGQTYCRLPKGARACDMAAGFALGGRTRGPLILRRPADGALFIVQATGDSSSGTTWVRSSFDGGGTWQGPTAVASGPGTISSAALAADGGSIFALYPAAAGGLTLQRGVFGAADPRSVVLDPSVNGKTAGESSDARIAVLPDGRMLTADETFKGVHWRFFGGGDPLDVNAWPRQGTLNAAQSPELVSGPRGTYLLDWRRPLHQDRGAFRVRSFDAKRARWRAPRWAAGDRRIYGGSSLAEDAGGRLHLVSEASTTGESGCVIYSRTARKRSSWFGRSTVLYRTKLSSRFPQEPQVAANAGGRGVAVWQDFDAARSGGHVRVARLRQAGGRYRLRSNEFQRPVCGAL
jgi:hypothetical protein